MNDFNEDDILFDVNIDKNVEWGALGRHEPNNQKIEVPHIDCLEPNATSDELKSIDGSSDEEDVSNRVRYLEFNPNIDMADPQFKVGMVFGTSKIFIVAIKEHGMKIEKAIELVKIDSMRVRATCKPPCQWILYASKMQQQPPFQIKTYVPTHNCVQSFKQVVQKDHKIGISRSQVYRTKRKAQELIEGSLMEQYAKLCDYCEQIKRTNQRITIIVKEDDEDSENEEHEIE
ncbi:uncharacterized protein LOC114264109 [Camellia sinensis]|uniref:uncharacterized protein LOC114264109 n=1 Tax=Camellia sinensis TaxID=4442 RepID=UPI0010365B10|nr:uncharacterized protein LOC114264109 [Camellia sinensis]